jgi:hypothetical protein
MSKTPGEPTETSLNDLKENNPQNTSFWRGHFTPILMTFLITFAILYKVHKEICESKLRLKIDQINIRQRQINSKEGKIKWLEKNLKDLEGEKTRLYNKNLILNT